MKGVLDFLEKAGLVRQESTAAADLPPVLDLGLAANPAVAPPALGAGAKPVSGVSGVLAAAPLHDAGAPAPKLEEVYASAGVLPSPYPAERLLRLIDGLSAMDQATRDMTIKAIDAADESWSIADPLADAAAKTKALRAHAARIQAQLQALERDTQSRLEAGHARQEKTLSDIRKQMDELEALAARESARGAKESAALEAQLRLARERATWELDAIGQTSRRLQSLVADYGPAGATMPGQG